MKESLIIFDTTMRDGEQSPGASMTREEKLRIARHLERMRVDVIEAGFPAASDGDFESVRAVAQAVKDSTVCGLARANEQDVRRCGEAVRIARSPRIHTFLATSPIHMEKKLRMEPSQVIEHAVRAVRWAREYTDNVEFSPEDAGRSDIDFLCRILERVIDAGATTINIPDTVGYTLPEHFGNLIGTLRSRIPNADKVVWSVHCHNDLGLAVANSLSAILAGARQVECTVNGLGERAGNASLEEIVMAVRTRQDVFPCDTGIDATQIVPASKLVSGITGYPVQPNKAVVGANAFAHESGIHQDGVLKYRETYEIMDPAHVGIPKNVLVLGKHSGRHAFRDRVTQLGYTVNDELLENAFNKFKSLADKKKEVFDEDIEALIDDQLELDRGLWSLVQLQVVAGSTTIPTATVVLKDSNGETVQGASDGDGPVDAIYSAIQRLTGITASLTDYRIRAVTKGKEALGEVQIELEHSGGKIRGRGLSTDILEASALAYLAAINRLRSMTNREKLVTQHTGV
jgi:2-isopropylmalate synthase